MIKRMHDIMVGICVLIAVLLAITTNYWLPYVNHMGYLFKDNVTLGLIGSVVVLLTLYDCKLGVAFAFVVAVIAVNMMQEGFEAFAGSKSADIVKVASHPPKGHVQNVQVAYNASKGTIQNVRFAGPTPKDSKKKQSIQQPRTQKMSKRAEGFQNMAPDQGVAVIAEKIEKQMVLPKSCAVDQKDFNTYSAGKDYHGFDVAGCRYDLENRTQNSTVYGPPLSWCATYGADSKLPVPFYPLNG